MILKLLVEREGDVVWRDEILEKVWGDDVLPSSRTIDNFIGS
jgi:two-component system, OmpR family, alkaline phosphatase synthesis response regulator PhoP